MPLRKFIFILCIFLLSESPYAQYKVSFIINRLPSYHKFSDTIFLAGSFNNWNPHDSKMALKMIHGKPGITIELQKGMYHYKFTEGGWDKVETLEKGFPSENRLLQVESDTTIVSDIQDWAWRFPKTERKSTASSNVHVIDTAFYIPQLNRYRRVWIYLPKSYRTSRHKYPVLYMHDGQNIFDEATSAYGEWGVDEALDSLGSLHREAIVVAVDNGGEKRLNEYAPFDMEKYGKGEGEQYVNFLAKTLKPYIDRHFRTKKGEKFTYVAGSSMGGLISFYAILKYPKVFGGAGVFSPAFWINPQLKNIDPKKAKKIKGKIFFYAGQQESDEMVPDMLYVFEQMRRFSKARLKTVIRGEGRHNEATWRAEFPGFYRWIVKK